MKNSSLLLNVCAESIHYVLSGLQHHFENISVFTEKKKKKLAAKCRRCCGNERNNWKSHKNVIIKIYFIPEFQVTVHDC